MIFTSYFDEADTDGAAPNIVMGAFLGHAYQWRQFEKKLSRIQEREGFRVFHVKKFKAKKGEFEGWTDEKCRRLVSDLTDLVRDNLTKGLTISLERERYLKEYRAPPIPRKMNLDSQYGVCFRGCLAHLLDLMGTRGYRDKLDIVFEGGHPNVGDCLRIFTDIKSRLMRLGCDVLGSFTIETKESCKPLMVSDFLASSYSMLKNTDEFRNQERKDAREKAKLNLGKPDLTFLELKSDALQDLKDGFERWRQLEIEDWRSRRATRKAASSSGEK